MTVGAGRVSELTILGDTPVSPVGRRRRPPANDLIIEGDAEYFERRSAEEQVFAESLADPRCRALHVELASRYAQLAAAIRESTPRTH